MSDVKYWRLINRQASDTCQQRTSLCHIHLDHDSCVTHMGPSDQFVLQRQIRSSPLAMSTTIMRAGLPVWMRWSGKVAGSSISIRWLRFGRGEITSCAGADVWLSVTCRGAQHCPLPGGRGEAAKPTVRVGSIQLQAARYSNNRATASAPGSICPSSCAALI